MNIYTILAIFAVIGASDRILGNRFGLGEEFEKGFRLLGSLALSMIGMIVLAPFIANLIKPGLTLISDVIPIDPSVFPALIFANDMGGAALAKELARDSSIGMFNALVVSAMMGCTISYTIPVSMETVDKDSHKELITGMLCGIATTPIGCFAAGIICGLGAVELLIDLIPVLIIAAVIIFGLLKFPGQSVKVLKILGYFIKCLITAGLAVGIVSQLLGRDILPHTDSFAEGARIVFNAVAVMSGIFPLLNIIGRLLRKQLLWLGGKLGINPAASMGILSSLASSLPTFEKMREMDKKGIVLNSAFAVSGAFVFCGHLSFTMAFAPEYVVPVIVGKLISGVSAVAAALIIYGRIYAGEK